MGVEGDEDHEDDHRLRRHTWARDVLARVWPGLHRMKLGLIMLTTLVFALTTLITLGLKHAGENGIKAENHLQSYISEMQVQDGLEGGSSAAGFSFRLSAKPSPHYGCAPGNTWLGQSAMACPPAQSLTSRR